MPPLSEKRRQQLDGIVQKMEADGQSPDYIQSVVSDFQSKYATESGDPDLSGGFFSRLRQAAGDAFTRTNDAITSPLEIGSHLVDVGRGAVKKFGETMLNAGEQVHKIPGVSSAVDSLYGTPGLSQEAFHGKARDQFNKEVEREGVAEGIGGLAMEAAEYGAGGGAARSATGAVRLIPRMMAEAAGTAGIAAAQGNDPEIAAVGGAAGPLAGAGARAAAPHLMNAGTRFVRAGIKPMLSALKAMPGASRGLDAQANQAARFIAANRLFNADQAEAGIQAIDQRLNPILQRNAQVPTDAGPRTMRYLNMLRRDAAAAPVAGRANTNAINSAGQAIMEGPSVPGVPALSEDVVSTVMRPHPTLVGPNGQPMMVPTQVTSRAIRQQVPVDEAMQMGRAEGRWSNSDAYGGLEGASQEATKAAERGSRDAVKAALPETRPLFRGKHQLINAKKFLDRAALREGNRDAITFGMRVRPGDMTSQVLGAAWDIVRNNQMRAGIYLNDLSRAAQNGDVETAARILSLLGVSVAADQ